ncbi:MAG TPA: nucleotide exchange factor GrpE [Gemmatimonadaceae bacterium]
MKHSKKKGSQTQVSGHEEGGQHTELPDQDVMGSADDFAPGGSSQGDGQSDVGLDTRPGVAQDPPGTGSETATTQRTAPDAGAPSDAATERDRYLRLAAEYDNFRKRSAKERQDAGARAQGDLVRQLIEALDDVARFAHVDPASTDAVTVVQGVDMVEKKLLKALGSAGLEVINPVGETFDPALHEAVATEPTSAKEDDHVVSRVYQPGYVFKSQLLRPARVVVKQWQG